MESPQVEAPKEVIETTCGSRWECEAGVCRDLFVCLGIGKCDAASSKEGSKTDE